MVKLKVSLTGPQTMEAKHSTVCHMRPLKSPDIFKDPDRVFAVLPHPRDARYVSRRNNDGAVLSPTAGSVLYPFRAVRESSTVQRPTAAGADKIVVLLLTNLI